jgi:hypothetical protein
VRLGLVAAAVASTVAAGPTAADPVRSLRVAVDGTWPYEGWAEVAGPGIGGSVAVAVRVSDDLDVTARVGVMPHLAVERAGLRTTVLEAPVLGGARLEVARAGPAVGFAFGEVGIVAVRTTVAIDGVRDHQSDLRFGSALGGGVAIGRVDVRIAAWLADLGDLDHGVGATLSIGTRVARW